MRYIFSTVLIGLLLLSSCGVFKTNSNRMKKRTISYMEKKIDENQFNPEWFSAKLKAKYKAEGKNIPSINLDIRIKKDSAIWISASPAIGFKLEVARVLITPNRIQVLDKFNKKYYDEDFGYIRQYIDYPFDFKTLQSLLFGYIIPTNGFNKTSIIKPNYVLESDDYMVYLDGKDYIISKTILQDGDRSLIANFEEYELVDKKPFSQKRQFLLKAEENYLIDLQFSKTKTTGPLGFPFEVNSKYTEVE